MYRISKYSWLLLAGYLALPAIPGQAAQIADKPSAELMAPKAEAIVNAVEEIEGRIVVSGWPVVLVRVLDEGEPWHIQSAVEEVSDGRFTGSVRFGSKDTPKGTAFAVLIVVAKSKAAAAKFREGARLNELPAGLPHSKEIVVYREAPGPRQPIKPRTVQFAGRNWTVKAGRRLGPGPNDFSDAKDNVALDADGYLHLVISKIDGNWRCAEIVADRSLGFGEYRWVVAGELPTLDRWAVLGLFTYETTTKEIDFELSRWGDKAKANAQFVVQPYTIKGNMTRFETGLAKILTVALVWDKNMVRGRCWAGEDTAKPPLADWTYQGRFVPQPGKERARANLWLFESRPPASAIKQEVIIRSFHFTPITDLKVK